MGKKVKVVVIGAGSAGLYALAEIRKKTDDFLLINKGPLGTTCARVGCMPSKSLIQAGADASRPYITEKFIAESGDALTRVRSQRDSFVAGVIESSIDPIRDRFIDGHARFKEPGVISVNKEIIEAERIVIATGSSPVIPDSWRQFADLILTSDNIFEQESLPASIAVIGLGAIGLELGQAVFRLGAEVTGVDQLEILAGLSDPEVNKKAMEIFSRQFPLWLGQAAEVRKEDGRLRVSAGTKSVVVEKILASLGRRPNVDDLGLENLGVELDDRGIPKFNHNTMQLENFPVFIAGDVNRTRPILHEAADEGRIAGYNAVRESAAPFERKTFLSISFCQPNIIEVGALYDELDQENTVVGEYDLKSSGRAIIMGNKQGLIRVYARKADGRLLGGALVAPEGEHLAHLLAWAVQQELTVGDLLKMPFYHPTLEETLQRACYDLIKKTEVKVSGLKELAEFKKN